MQSKEMYRAFFAGAELLPFSVNFLFFWLLAICTILKPYNGSRLTCILTIVLGGDTVLP